MVHAELRPTDLRVLRERLGISQEMLARVLDVSSRSVERWEAGAAPTDQRVSRLVDRIDEIAALGIEVYGSGLATFMRMPRRALGGRSPAAALVAGDLDGVMGLLAQAAEAQFA